MSETPNLAAELATPSAPAEGLTTPPTDTVTAPRAELVALAAEAAGLSPELASRLQGSNLTELVADARTLAAALKPPESQTAPEGFVASPEAPGAAAAPSPEPVGHTPEGQRREPPRNGWTRDSVAHLAKSDPTKFNNMVESGELNLGSLR